MKIYQLIKTVRLCKKCQFNLLTFSTGSLPSQANERKKLENNKSQKLKSNRILQKDLTSEQWCSVAKSGWSHSAEKESQGWRRPMSWTCRRKWRRQRRRLAKLCFPARVMSPSCVKTGPFSKMEPWPSAFSPRKSTPTCRATDSATTRSEKTCQRPWRSRPGRWRAPIVKLRNGDGCCETSNLKTWRWPRS